ncbi:hypothetical protein EZV62_024483 [Acer yangbiense]|uniref:RNase H type-1 domain-containing protein n=1 Tax=Acer yangbiense TaxID=1000413 RepID=A0A5C7GV88_9ROSI|nr:hypothetical protein EZV62_024483 [Acer yangbiense]
MFKPQWIPKPPNFKVSSSRVLPEGVSISALIESPGKWCEELVFRYFNREEAVLILGIPLSVSRRRDSWLWHYDKKGFFSVKSAYKVALDLRDAYVASSSSGSISWWKRLCLLNLPTVCGFCGVHVESVDHALWGCDRLCRNQILYDSGDCVGGKVWDRAVDYVKNLAYVFLLITQLPGMVLLLRVVSGKLLHLVSSSLTLMPAVTIVEVAEAKSIFEGLLMAIDYGLLPIQIESDAMGVVNLCNGKTNSFGDVANIIADIQDLIGRYEGVSIVYIPRAWNKVAHAIAGWALGMFYGPGGPYAIFAGRDASRALALMSFDPQDLTGNIEGLSESELEVLHDWELKFIEKYIKVGQIVSD